MSVPRVGVLALQGDVSEHRAALAEAGAEAREVRRPTDLAGVDGLVLPGGESTTLSMLLDSSGLREPVGALLDEGLPTFGTCAGLVLLGTKVLDGRPDQQSYGALDCTVRRNGYGRQLASFEAEIDPSRIDRELGDGAAPSMPAVFIRAPVVEAVGPDVEVLATLDSEGDRDEGQPVVCRQGSVLVTSFHPELTSDRRLHRLFVAMVERSARRGVRTGRK